MKILNSPINAGILAIILFIAAHFFLKQYHQYLFYQEKRDAVFMRLRLARKQQTETRQKQQVLLKVKAFLDQAKSMGLEQKSWSVYDINIDGPVTFFELAQILNQCTNTSSFYFKPILFHVKSAAESEKNIKNKTPPTRQADSPEFKTGDILLTLKGAFIVKEE